jgi:hypothetical protein
MHLREGTERGLAQRIVLAGAVIAAVAGVSLVYAAWTATGQGSGYAKATSADALTTEDASAASAGAIYPGATGDVVVDVKNPNPFAVQLTAVTLRGTSADIAPDADHQTCAPTGVSFADQRDLSVDVAARSTRRVTLQGAISMSNASASGCQGAVFDVPVALEAHSVDAP